MDFGAALDVLAGDLAAPPGHERAVEAAGEPFGPIVLEMQAEAGGSASVPGKLRRIEEAALASQSRAPGAREAAPVPGQRLVSAEVGLPPAGTAPVPSGAGGPAGAVGRLTAMFDGRIRYCTATIVAERVALTAAHCVFRRTASDGERHFANWIVFQPQYEDGRALGRWAGEVAYVLSGWQTPPPHMPANAYDFALVRLDAPIAAKTGQAGLLLNARPDGPFTSLGYPRQPTSAHAFDGTRLYASHGLRLSAEFRGVIKAENQLTEGSSGGPWLTVETGAPLIAGINSTKPVDSDETTWSPRLGRAFHHLLSHVLAEMTGV